METITAIDEAFGRAAGLDGLVIDLRNTPSGGNTDVARALLGHLVASKGRSRCSAAAGPGAWGRAS